MRSGSKERKASNEAELAASQSIERFPDERRITKPAYNRLHVSASLFHNGPESRVGLCRRTGLPLSRLSAICGDLLRDGLIRESVVTPAGGNGRGRPQTLLEINLRGLGAACVRYDRNQMTAAVADLSGTVRWQRRWAGPFGENPGRLLRRVIEAARRATDAGSKAGVRVMAVGAADPGTVDVAAGRAVRAVNVPGWQNIPVVEHLRRATGLPVVIQRGDGWQALGEVAFGAGRGARHALYVTLLEGIGGGIVERGRLLAGRDGSAGEIGHTRVSEGGPRCGCGGLGCLEAHLAPGRMAGLWRTAATGQDPPARPGTTPGDDFRQMLQAARENDRHAREILADAARALARGLGNAVTLLNPERIILGGRFVESGDLILEPLKQALPRYGLLELVEGIEIRLAELGEVSTFLGMAAYVRDRLFAYPKVGARFNETDEKAPIHCRWEAAT